MGFLGYLKEMFIRVGFLALGVFIAILGFSILIGNAGEYTVLSIIGFLLILVGAFTIFYPRLRPMKV